MKKINAYKVFNPDMTCRGFQYEVGKEYEAKGDIIICANGFHACENLADCFNYYSFDPNNKIAEVVLSGTIIKENDKLCAQKIKIKKLISWETALAICNSGDGNSGYGNSGDKNSGHGNSGNYNSGNYNSGNKNSGDWNSGNYNNGYLNSNKPNKIRIFNKYIDTTGLDFPDYFYFDLTEFVSHDTATEEEKEKYKKEIETCGGFLRTLGYKEAWIKSYNKASSEDKAKTKMLPNFDADIFFEITGIKID